jgi:hypothetical protein
MEPPWFERGCQAVSHRSLLDLRSPDGNVSTRRLSLTLLIAAAGSAAIRIVLPSPVAVIMMAILVVVLMAWALLLKRRWTRESSADHGGEVTVP